MATERLIEVDGDEKLRELSDTFERGELEVIWHRCPCGGCDFLEWIEVPSLSATFTNVALAEECGGYRAIHLSEAA